MVGDAMEGWYTDPFERHEARWLSAGRPTKLVRDGTVESYDEPPDEEPIQVPERIEVDPSNSGAEDLRRADEAERDMPSADAIADAVSIAFERSRPPGP